MHFRQLAYRSIHNTGASQGPAGSVAFQNRSQVRAYHISRRRVARATCALLLVPSGTQHSFQARAVSASGAHPPKFSVSLPMAHAPTSHRQSRHPCPIARARDRTRMPGLTVRRWRVGHRQRDGEFGGVRTARRHRPGLETVLRAARDEQEGAGGPRNPSS